VPRFCPQDFGGDARAAGAAELCVLRRFMRNALAILSYIIIMEALVCSRVGIALAAPSASDVAVIVGPDVLEDQLRLPELGRIVLGDTQFWKSGKRVTLLIRAPVAH